MQQITISAVVDKDRRLALILPDDAPIGPVEITIRAAGSAPIVIDPDALTREQVREKLREAGLLSEMKLDVDNPEHLSPEEADRLARLFSGPRPIEELIDEDRGEY